MKIQVYSTKKETSRKAAQQAAEILKEAINRKNKATFIAATGLSQTDFLDYLSQDPEIDWSKTEMFHLDEYVGIPDTHPASFRKYLKERFIEKVHPGTVHLINGSSDQPDEEVARLNQLMADKAIDIAFIGIGENGHVAFNDPPADFETEDPFIVVTLDQACKKQQVGEGWFASLNEVPSKAITMSVSQILKSNNIICTVPGERKAEAVKKCFEGEVSPHCPASILKKHENAFIYLDEDSAQLLEKTT
ncbi:MAG: glucosamine-6-phosphate deaminase [Bacteroidales bacterium]|nr:glucosamine-6-phosphate deaminase [Bacteroidales bacterium]